MIDYVSRWASLLSRLASLGRCYQISEYDVVRTLSEGKRAEIEVSPGTRRA